MKRKRTGTRLTALILAFLLVGSMWLSPVADAFVSAEETEPVTETQTGETAIPEEPEADLSVQSDAGEEEAAAESAEEETKAAAASASAEDVTAADTAAAAADAQTSEVGELKLVYGDESLADKDALVLTIFGDGFTAEQQDTFYEKAKETAEYVMKTSPWDEFTDSVKFYAIGTVSNESGSRADQALTQNEADADTRDTYFGSTFWSNGMQRLVSIGSEGTQKINALTEEYNPLSDYSVLIVNSTTYGGSGGDICVASLNTSSLEMMLHELGHTIAKLSDEYFAGATYAREYANMTAESDPAKVKWSRFIGKNGVGVYEYDNGGDGWYRPSQNCKMRYLGAQYAFCEVCKEELRKSFCQASDVTKLFFQTYADVFHEGDAGVDMAQYFIIRRGDQETTGDQLGDALTLVYKDSEGNVLEGIPSKAGTYTVEASFAGNDTYAACTQTATYTIELPDRITLDIPSKVYDGEAAVLNCSVDYDKAYTTEVHYTGTLDYVKNNEYDSEEAPSRPGTYTVTVTAYDKETGEAISRKSASFQITFKTTELVNNNTSEYTGAAVYYNNQSIAILGEGFTAEEQDKFEALAKEYVDTILNTEPFKETKLYFNFTTVETVSGSDELDGAHDTFFETTVDENGTIVPTEWGSTTAQTVAYKEMTAYYKAAIVIVNDDTVKTGARPWDSTKNRYGRIIYAGANDAGKQYAADELLNYFTNQDTGYRAETDAEKEALRTGLLQSVYYTWGFDFALITSRAYDETFVEDGTAYDLAPYFHTYILGQEAEGVTYTMSYYADDNGQPGEKLDSAPSKAGTYHAKAELVPEDGAKTMYGMPYTEVTLNDTIYKVPLSRGWTTYTIQAKETPSDPQNPSGQENGGKTDVTNPSGTANSSGTTNTANTTKTSATAGSGAATAKTGAVKTGDSFAVTGYVILTVVSAGVVVLLLAVKRRRNRI